MNSVRALFVNKFDTDHYRLHLIILCILFLTHVHFQVIAHMVSYSSNLLAWKTYKNIDWYRTLQWDVVWCWRVGLVEGLYFLPKWFIVYLLLTSLIDLLAMHLGPICNVWFFLHNCITNYKCPLLWNHCNDTTDTNERIKKHTLLRAHSHNIRL